MCNVYLCKALLCDSLLFSSQNKFRPHVFRTMNSRLELGKHLTVSPLPSHRPSPSTSLLLSLSLSISLPDTLPLSACPYASPCIFLCLFSHLSDLISRSDPFIPPLRENRFSSAWNGWWEIEFPLRVSDVTYWPITSVKHNKREKGSAHLVRRVKSSLWL